MKAQAKSFSHVVISLALILVNTLYSPGQVGETRRPKPAATDAIVATAAIETTGHNSSSISTRRILFPVAAYHSTPSKEALVWAGRVIRRMTLDEKIGQLISIGINASFLNQDSAAFREFKREVVENHIGGITLFRGPVYESVMLVNRLQQAAKYPLLIAADLEAGAGMRFDDTINFPWNMAVGATGNVDYARRQGEITAREARALGIQQIFAPVVDINNNAANPVINVRSYGEDPMQVARFAEAFIKGAQSNGVISTAKHFPGHGDTATDSHRGLPVINVARHRLDSIELVPFRAAVQAGVGAVMSAHIGLPQIDSTTVSPLSKTQTILPSYVDAGGEVMTENAVVPATLSPIILNQLLRRDLDFHGIVVSDALDMSGLTLYFTQEEAAVRAVSAGVDMLLKPADADAMMRGLRAAVKEGRLSETRIAESAQRILAAKYDLGLVKNRLTSLENIDTIVSRPDAFQLAREIAEHAITLVRNDLGLLPLAHASADLKIVNLVLTNGDDRYSVSSTFDETMARNGKRVETIVLDERSTDEDASAALEKAGRADLVIASLYGRVRTGQARSGRVPEQGTRILEKLIERKKPIIGISFGNPYVLQSFPRLQTYLVAYGDMPSLQQAAARAVLGEIPVTGRLPITLPAPLFARGTGIQLSAKTDGM